MQIGVPRETLAGETRVAASPKSVEQLLKLGFEVCVESQAGALASFEDAAYEQAGAKVVTADEAWKSDIIFKVNAPIVDESKTKSIYLKMAQHWSALFGLLKTQN